MSVIMTWIRSDSGVTFQCAGDQGSVPFAQWGRLEVRLPNGRAASLAHLNYLIEEGLAQESDDGTALIVPYGSLADLEGWQLRSLGLPEVSPLRLAIDTPKALVDPGFSVSYRFEYPDGLPAYGFARNGALLEKNGNTQYLLQDPVYSLCELLDGYREEPIQDIDARFLWWSSVKELIPTDAEVSSFLKRINVIRPEAFSVDIREQNGDLLIVPRLIASDGVDDWAEGMTLDLVPPAVGDEFAGTFLREPSVRTKYALRGNWFLAIPRTVRAALEVVHRVNYQSIERRRGFVQNPKRFIRETMEGDLGAGFDEGMLESVFVETPLFLSERIKFLGVWQPKAGIFFKTETGQWLPGDELPEAIHIPLGDGVYEIDRAEIGELAATMRQAGDRGETSVEHRGMTIPVTNDSLSSMDRAMSLIASRAKPEGKERAEKSPQNKPLVPIIFDHIDELGDQATPQGQREVVAAEPVLTEGVTLHLHQQVGLNWLRSHWGAASPGGLLADDMGLGKTIQTLAFLSWVRQQQADAPKAARPFLIVAPTGLLVNWEKEAERFIPSGVLGELIKAHGAAMRRLMDRGPSDAGKRLGRAGWVLTTYETLRDKINAFVGVYWAVVVFDEAQKIKNPQVIVTDMAKSLKAEFTLALTGTPVENSLVDLWCITDAVQPGRLGTLKEFNSTYQPGGKPGPGNLKDLKVHLERPASHPVILRRNKEDHWAERPQKIDLPHTELMPPVQAQAYSSAVKDAKKAKGTPGAMLKALHELRSISLHPAVYDWDPSDPEAFINTSARLKVLFRELDEVYDREEKALIFLEYRDMQSILSELIERRYGVGKILLINGAVSGAKRQARVDAFQRGASGFDIMILSPKAGGVGLTLTAATHVFHLSRWWNPAVEDQCSDRAYRIGQTRPVSIHYPLAVHPEFGRDGSFDVKLDQLLQKKRRLSRSLLAPPAGTHQDVEDLYGDLVGESDHEALISEQVDLDGIDLMEPVEFEDWVLISLQRLGYSVQRTPTTGDAGADGVAIAPPGSGWSNLIMQCKHTQTFTRLGPNAVTEVCRAKSHYLNIPEPVRLVVITNAPGFTATAEKVAASHSVLLLDRDCLGSLSRHFG